MLLLIGLAQAHPDSVPHLHPPDPATTAPLLFWGLLGAAWLAWAWHRVEIRGERPVDHLPR